MIISDKEFIDKLSAKLEFKERIDNNLMIPVECPACGRMVKLHLVNKAEHRYMGVCLHCFMGVEGCPL